MSEAAAPAPEFSRPLRIDQIGEGRRESIAADDAERAALTRRFDLRALDRLEADYVLRAIDGGWQAEGQLRADAVQACVATDQDVRAHLDLPFTIRFEWEAEDGAEEVELSDDDCDVMPVEQDRIDMGEAVAQTLALNLPPYPRAANAEEVLRAAGVKSEEEMGPLAGLKDLLKGGGG